MSKMKEPPLGDPLFEATTGRDCFFADKTKFACDLNRIEERRFFSRRFEKTPLVRVLKPQFRVRSRVDMLSRGHL